MASLLCDVNIHLHVLALGLNRVGIDFLEVLGSPNILHVLIVVYMIDVLFRAEVTVLVEFKWGLLHLLLSFTLTKNFLYLFYCLLLSHMGVSQAPQHLLLQELQLPGLLFFFHYDLTFLLNIFVFSFFLPFKFINKR